MTNNDWSQFGLCEKAPHFLESQNDDDPLQPNITKIFDWMSNAKFDPTVWRLFVSVLDAVQSSSSLVLFRLPSFSYIIQRK